jgi:hypothetical protein
MWSIQKTDHSAQRRTQGDTVCGAPQFPLAVKKAFIRHLVEKRVAKNAVNVLNGLRDPLGKRA